MSKRREIASELLFIASAGHQGSHYYLEKADALLADPDDRMVEAARDEMLDRTNEGEFPSLDDVRAAIRAAITAAGE